MIANNEAKIGERNFERKWNSTQKMLKLDFKGEKYIFKEDKMFINKMLTSSPATPVGMHVMTSRSK